MQKKIVDTDYSKTSHLGRSLKVSILVIGVSIFVICIYFPEKPPFLTNGQNNINFLLDAMQKIYCIYKLTDFFKYFAPKMYPHNK